MCVEFTSEVLVAEEDIVVYKVVHKEEEDYSSIYHPDSRSYQDVDDLNIGTLLGNKEWGYEIGVEVRTDFQESFGFYCYCSLPDAKEVKWQGFFRRILMCKIPKGTRYVLGLDTLGGKTINVERLIPLEEV